MYNCVKSLHSICNVSLGTRYDSEPASSPAVGASTVPTVPHRPVPCAACWPSWLPREMDLLVGNMQVGGTLCVGTLRQEGLWVWMEQSGDSGKERWVGVQV